MNTTEEHFNAAHHHKYKVMDEHGSVQAVAHSVLARLRYAKWMEHNHNIMITVA